MSWRLAARSSLTASVVVLSAAGLGKVAIFSSSSMAAGSYFFSTKPSPCASAEHFVGVDPIDQPIEMLPQPRVGAGAVGRFEQHVYRPIEVAARALEVAHLQFALAGFEVLLRGADEGGDGIDSRLRRPDDDRRRGRGRRDAGTCGLGFEPQAASRETDGRQRRQPRTILMLGTPARAVGERMCLAFASRMPR